MQGTVIVTGGFGALGRAVIAELECRGATPAAVDLAPLPDGYSGLAKAGIDLTDEDAVAEAYGQIANESGAIAGLVNVAGGFIFENLADGSSGSWQRMFAMNLATASISCRAALPFLSGGSAIVNIGAAAALKASAGMTPYAASKAGVMALTEGLADELSGRRIRVNAVLPTILDTPANRADMPDADFGDWVGLQDAARVIAFLLSPGAACITGAGIPLTGIAN